jgi:hypothetical protein
MLLQHAPWDGFGTLSRGASGLGRLWIPALPFGGEGRGHGQKLRGRPRNPPLLRNPAAEGLVSPPLPGCGAAPPFARAVAQHLVTSII